MLTSVSTTDQTATSTHADVVKVSRYKTTANPVPVSYIHSWYSITLVGLLHEDSSSGSGLDDAVVVIVTETCSCTELHSSSNFFSGEGASSTLVCHPIYSGCTFPYPRDRHQCSHVIFFTNTARFSNLYTSTSFCKGKGKASSLDIAPLTILDSGALQSRKWQLIGNDCSTAAHAVAAQSPR